MSGAVNVFIMTSKIMIDLDGGLNPCIRVKLPDSMSEDVRDKIVKHFFERLGGNSSFVGVVFRGGNTHADLVPLSLGDSWEWMSRLFIEKAMSHSNDSGVRVRDLCVELSDLIFSEDYNDYFAAKSKDYLVNGSNLSE
jgi:hypothetical protein